MPSMAVASSGFSPCRWVWSSRLRCTSPSFAQDLLVGSVVVEPVFVSVTALQVILATKNVGAVLWMILSIG
jgi:hypothetical protein